MRDSVDYIYAIKEYTEQHTLQHQVATHVTCATEGDVINYQKNTRTGACRF